MVSVKPLTHLPASSREFVDSGAVSEFYSATVGLVSDIGEMKILRRRSFGSLGFWGHHRLLKCKFAAMLHQRYKLHVCMDGFDVATVFFSTLGQTLYNGCFLL